MSMHASISLFSMGIIRSSFLWIDRFDKDSFYKTIAVHCVILRRFRFFLRISMRVYTRLQKHIRIPHGIPRKTSKPGANKLITHWITTGLGQCYPMLIRVCNGFKVVIILSWVFRINSLDAPLRIDHTPELKPRHPRWNLVLTLINNKELSCHNGIADFDHNRKRFVCKSNYKQFSSSRNIQWTFCDNRIAWPSS